MPEIKHQFTGGKMNKDLDERLVPNGEYRDAMNVQVSTSEGSDVGTVQNILGNSLVLGQQFIDDGSSSVGSVADEKNDALYWMIAGPDRSISSLTSEIINASVSTPVYAKDLIARSANGLVEPILVDKYAALLDNPGTNTIGSDNFLIIPTKNVVDIRPGMALTGIASDGTVSESCVVESAGSVDSFSQIADFQYNLVSTPGFNSNFAITFGGDMKTQQFGGPATGNSSPNGKLYILSSVWNSANTIGISVGDPITFNDPVSGNLLVPAGTVITHITTGVGVVNGYNSYSPPSGPFYLSYTEIKISNTIIDQTTLSQPEYPINGAATLLSPEDASGNPQQAYIDITSTLDVIVYDGDIHLQPGSIWSDNVTVGLAVNSNLSFPEIPGNPGVGGYISSVAVQPGYIEIQISDAAGNLLIPQHSFNPLKSDYLDFTLSSSQTLAVGESIIQLDRNIDLNAATYGYLYFEGDRLLNFNKANLITGINVLDEMLFWTDNYTEPKKINIPRSIEGTDKSGNIHTRLINSEIGTEVSLREEHITVIKKAPTTPLFLDLITDRIEGVNYSGKISVSDDPATCSFIDTSADRGATDFNTYSVGQVFRVSVLEDVDGNPMDELVEFAGLESTPNELWREGTKVVLREYDSDGDAPTIPISEYVIKGVVSPWQGNNFKAGENIQADPDEPGYNPTGQVQMSIAISSIDGFPPQAEAGEVLNYAIDIFKETEKLFEFKFPRFSYRYKYQDGEYSTYAPFSDVAFIPGTFDYHSKKGYNLAMTNRVASVFLNQFVTQDMPSDVVSIDLLYKEDSSSSVFVVDTIKPTGKLPVGSSSNFWYANSYELKSDAIHSLLPSNQLLRPWDNVPRMALAQDVTGNRIVYGNYLQNYSLNVEGNGFEPNFKHELFADELNTNSKSIKSLRDYQLGVVFIDAYGRETPVLSNPSGAFRVEKAAAFKENRLQVGLRGNEESENIPNDFKYYKFFIKETSGEYYNMAMDRYYDAADENHWLAFPSSDRNKVDIDTVLILKKGPDSDELVKAPARYKILAIENEAPDFIKTSQYLIAQFSQDMLLNAAGEPISNAFGLTGDTAPLVGRKSFSIGSGPLSNSSAINLHEIEDDLYVEFGLSGSNETSERYRITNLAKDSSDDFKVTLEKVLGNDVDFMSTQSQGSFVIKNGTQVKIYKYVVENKPKFDGKFFVKIYADDTFNSKVAVQPVDSNTEYRTVASRKIFALRANNDLIHGGDYGSAVYGGAFNFSVDGGGFGATQTGNTPIASGYDGWDLERVNSQIYQGFKAYYGKWEISSKGFEFNNTTQTPFPDGSRNFMEKSDNHNNKALRQSALERDFVVSVDSGPRISNETDSKGRWKFEGNNQPGFSSGTSYFNEEGAIEFSFGSIEAASMHKYKKWMRFFGLEERDDSKYDFIKPLLKQVNAGKQFRWKDDPNGTIYTIVKQVRTYNRINHTNRHNDGENNSGDWGDNKTPDSNNDGRAYNRPYNYRMSKKFNFTPSFQGRWDPTEATPGAISGGKIVNYFYNASAGAVQSLKASGTQPAANKVKISKTHFENSQQGNQVGGTKYSVEVGMILTFAEHSNLTHPLLVKAIEPINDGIDGYTIEFTGYQNINNEVTIAAGKSLKFEQPTMNGLSQASAENITHYSTVGGSIGAVGYEIEFIEPIEREAIMPENPAVWETEPKESTDLDIYHEISGSNPIKLDRHTIKTALPVGSKVASMDGVGGGTSDLYIVSNNSVDGDTIVLSEYLTIQGSSRISAGDILRVTRPDGTSIAIRITEKLNLVQIGGVSYSKTFAFDPFLYSSNIHLTWHNCFSFNNGVESNRIRDNFNLPYVANGVVASTTLDKEHQEEHRKHGLIYSGIYNSTAGINNLNQFIAAEKITKEINPIYGSIQKIHSRATADGDLIVLCEDRVLKVLANKDALYNADGNPQLTATNNVLGQTIPYSGDYGISKNPESFASDAYRIYFTDKVRGAVLRLSKDGLTPISDAGMKDWFRDNLNGSNQLIGSYDDRKDNYNISLSERTELADELIMNGGFQSDPITNWFQSGSGDHWTWDSVNNTMYADADPHDRLGQTLPVELTTGKSFEISWEVSEQAGLELEGKVWVTLHDNYGNYKSLYPDGFTYEQKTAKSSVGFTKITVKIDEAFAHWQWSSGLENSIQFHIKKANGVWFNSAVGNVSVTEIIPIEGTTVSFSENVKGWSSFKSFVPESSVSVANNYYTTNNGKLYKHHDEKVSYNNFYGNDYNSSLNVILNDEPGVVKTFHTLNYEGSDGWVASEITTNKEKGSSLEFVEKEGKWFNYIKGVNTDSADELDTSAFNVQGISALKQITTTTNAQGVTYDIKLTIDGSINSSLQIGDTIFYQQNQSGGAVKFGVVEKINSNSITVNKSVFGNPVDPLHGAFILFSKDNSVNQSSLIGYFADVKLENSSKHKVELFSVGTEIAISSK